MTDTKLRYNTAAPAGAGDVAVEHETDGRLVVPSTLFEAMVAGTTTVSAYPDDPVAQAVADATTINAKQAVAERAAIASAAAAATAAGKPVPATKPTILN